MERINKTVITSPHNVRLPFDNRREDPGEWAYNHRVGLCVTVIAFLLMGIIFVSSKIAIGEHKVMTGIVVETESVSYEKPDEKIDDKAKMISGEDYESVKNRVSNDNADPNNTRQQMKGGGGSKEYSEADEVMRQMQANREAYEKGLGEADAILNGGGSRGGKGGAANSGGSSGSGSHTGSGRGNANKGQDVKVVGDVSVRFSLTNPFRIAVDLPVPAYRCENAGKVIVNITVNRSGRVVGQSIANASSTDKCLTDMALEAARTSVFNADPSAPERQGGTIEYVFARQ